MGGVRFPSRSRRLSLAWHTRLVLHLLGASPDWLIVKPFGGVALGSGLVPLEGRCRFGRRLCIVPGVGLAPACYHCVPFWLDACQALRWGGLRLGLVGPHAAMALDLGRSLVSKKGCNVVKWGSTNRPEIPAWDPG